MLPRAYVVAAALSLIAISASLTTASIADADADMDRAEADADFERWSNYVLEVKPKTQNTDGEMYWLREMHITYTSRIDNNQAPVREHGVLLVGPLTIAGAPRAVRGQVQNFDLDPTLPPMDHADFAAFLALTAPQKAWITARAADFNGWNAGPYPAANGIVSAGLVAGCHATVINALVAAGAGATDDARGLAQLATMGNGPGGAGLCTVTAPLDRIRRWTGVIAAHNAEWTHLIDHYARVMAYAPAGVDVWVLRDWLHLTDPEHGHRVLGATGFAVRQTGTNQYGAERRMVQTGYYNAVYNGPGLPGYGWPTDTAGHVRPRSLGGQRDPVNFVPQSTTGQKMVGAGEALAQKLVGLDTNSANNPPFCHGLPANSVRYGVYFTYTAPADRRPARARTVVDLLNPCTSNGPRAGTFGVMGAALAAGTPIWDQDWPTF